MVLSLFRKIHELESCLSQTRITSKVSVDAVSSQLSEKSHELNSVRMELERFKANMAALEASQRSAESTTVSKVCCGGRG
jgi:uncharacterized membrane protein